MIKRSFGDGTSVSVLGIGCSRVGSISNPAPMRDIEATLEAAVAAGVNLFDTANIYGQGDSERTLGRLLRRHGDRMFVVTKAGGRHGRYAPVVRLAKPLLRILVRSRPKMQGAIVTARTATVVHDFSPDDLDQAVEGSRQRLNLDRLHALLLHSPSVETLRKPEIHDFLADIVQRGKVAHAGASIDSLEALEVAVRIPALSMIQAPLDVAEALPGTAVLKIIQQRNIGLFVREILRRPNGPKDLSPQEKLSAAFAPAFVTAAIVGASTPQHLNDLLTSVR